MTSLRASLQRTQGLIAAPHTPFDASGSLDLHAIDRQLEHLSGQGVVGAFVCGSTGECASLSVSERIAICEKWSQSLQSRPLRLFVHVGTTCQPDAIELASHAETVGAAAIAAFAPHYFKPRSAEELIAFLRPIAAAAPSLPFYFYDIPQLTGVELNLEHFLSLALDELPTFCGVKYTNPDLVQLQLCMKRFGRQIEFLFGCDELLLAGLCVGVEAAIGSTYNFAARLYHDLIAAFQQGDMERARELQGNSVQLVTILDELGFMRAAKAMMSLVGADCGAPRAPMFPLSQDEITQLRRQLEDGDLRSWCC